MKFVKNRKGLSTVVTAAIMLTFIAVLGTTLIAWSNSKLHVFETSLANSTTTLTNQISESAVFENVQFCHIGSCNFSFQALNVTITNIGTEGITITQLKVNGTDLSSGTQYGSSHVAISTNPLKLLPYQSTPVIVFPVGWNHHSQSTITVVSSRGTIFTTNQVAP